MNSRFELVVGAARAALVAYNTRTMGIREIALARRGRGGHSAAVEVVAEAQDAVFST